MPRTRVISAVIAVVLGSAVLASPTEARRAETDASLASMPLPGGLRAALDALGDAGSEDHAQFLLEIIRRFHHSAVRRDDPGDAFGRLLTHLEGASTRSGVAELVPLPLGPAMWVDAIFGGRASRDTLVLDILRSRGAALLYSGLLSLDGSTRAWLADRPALLAEIASASGPAFATAAPGFRVASGAVRVPGGEAFVPAWEALAGRRTDEPEEFLRALLAYPRGRLAYLIAALAPLSDMQVALLLAPTADDDEGPARRAPRLLALLDRLAPGWDVAERTFWRPARDPALMAAELTSDREGRPRLPGTRAFWRLALKDPAQGPGHAGTPAAAARNAAAGPPVDFLWLAEQVFGHPPQEQDSRYELVLFASRVVDEVTPDGALDALDAVRTAAAYPALRTALERAGIADAAAFAAAGRRASLLAGITNQTRARRAHAQYQGALALLTTSARRGSLPVSRLTSDVQAVAAIETTHRGEYEGRLVRWLEAHLGRAPLAASRRGASADEAGTLDTALRDAVAGARTPATRVVAWEGVRYRVDLARAERVRLDQQLGAHAPPYASAALAVVHLADALGTSDAVPQDAVTAFEAVARDIAWDGPALRAVARVQRQIADGRVRGDDRLRRDLLLAADELLGRGLTELAYAAALGHPDRTPISAVEAAARHDFGSRRDRRPHAPWQLPVERTDVARGWQMAGSLLGLDVRLAAFALIPWSPKPPPRRPSLNEQDRRVFVETVALVDSALLADADRDAIVEAMARGRARLASVRSPADAERLAAGIGLSPARRALLPWTVQHHPDSLSRFLSPGELLALGLDGAPPEARLHAWGAPGRPRLGCQCLRLVNQPWEIFAGRWNSGMFASAFPDLNLRIAELLATLEMPASLLGPVLAPALLDFVNLVISRHPDDRRGLLDFVHSLQVEDVEQYLALLTTDGPLVVVGDAADAVAGAGGFETGAQP